MGKIGLFVGGVFLAGLAVVGWQILNPAPTNQGHSMVPPNTSDITQGAPIVNILLPAELSQDAQIGKRAFEVKCAACHGENAAGQNGVAPPLVHRIYEPNHHGDEAFVRAALNGVRSHHWSFGDMPPVEGLARAEVLYIARYIRELQRENGIN